MPALSKGKTRINLHIATCADLPFPTSELKDETIHIRVAGVDAPEAAHFGRPSQPYSAEALAWLKAAIEGKRVRCLLLRRDQYARVVCAYFDYINQC